jgi:hypothetical protein
MRSATPSGRIVSIRRADDWICTSMSLFTRQAPFSVEPRRQARARGVERAPPRSGGPASFGDWLLSQEHTRVLPTARRPLGGFHFSVL